ncbi:MAG: gamma-glutamyltransferase [Acidobacteriota bacterium]|nr:gamma-glutamyltransferase [Acidobacteriota bacterium]
MSGRNQARSMVISPLGIVATSQTLASQAGSQVLARGGSAMDAAIAANAVLGVVEPMSDGIGGDLFAIYWEGKAGKLTGINASGWAPKGLNVDLLRKQGFGRMPESGVHSITVPGCVDGWWRLHKRFGRLLWGELFSPAIYFARNGFPLTEIIQGQWLDSAAKLSANDYTRRLFLPHGAAPALAEIFRNPDLTRVLQAIADGGADAFYRGPIAKAILRTLDTLGGTMSSADLSEYESEWVTPLSTRYRDWTVYELPPNGQGLAALEMLNILERFPIPDLAPESSAAFHLKIEAQKLAYDDLRKYLADPRHGDVPSAALTSKEYAAARAALIDPHQAHRTERPGNPLALGGDTVYLSAADREGNIASLIQSLYHSFGSGIAVDGFGFHLQNRGALFDLDPNHPNALAPRKRPLHTIIPAFMEKGDVRIGFGIMGGFNQAQAHAQFVSNLVDHGMNIQAALEAPRFTKQTLGGCDAAIENRVPVDTREELGRLGHQLQVVGAYSSVMGGGQAVLHNSATGINYGASSPRKDGAAIPEPASYFEK